MAALLLTGVDHQEHITPISQCMIVLTRLLDAIQGVVFICKALNDLGPPYLRTGFSFSVCHNPQGSARSNCLQVTSVWQKNVGGHSWQSLLSFRTLSLLKTAKAKSWTTFKSTVQPLQFSRLLI